MSSERSPIRLRLFATIAVLAIVFVRHPGGAAPRFYPDDPLWTDQDTAFDASKVQRKELSEGFDFIENTFGHPGDHRSIHALNTNTLDDVPDSSWFTNRIGRQAMSIPEIVRGPNQFEKLEITDWLVTGSKGPAGFQPGFRAVDARDSSGRAQTYQLELDLRDYAELATSAEMIGTMIYHAIGYNVVDTYIVNVDPKKLRIKEGTMFRDASGRRPVVQRDLDEIFALARPNPDGTYRMTASRFVEGAPIGAFQYYGTRSDDPNDLYPHEHRRELRGNRVFCAWLNHDDSRAINSLDMLVTNNGRAAVKHYMFDFGSILGSSPDRTWSGVAYMHDGHAALKGLLSLGLWVEPHQALRYPTNLPAIGRIEGDVFEPVKWKPEYPNQAFKIMRPDDAFWAARIVAQFSNDAIAAIVKQVQFSDPRSTEYLTSVLIKRRDAVLKYWLNEVNPVVDFELRSDGTLSFDNASIKAGASTRGNGYTVAWARFDNATNAAQPVGAPERVTDPTSRVPEALGGADYVVVTVRGDHPEHKAWAQPVRAFFHKENGGWKTVGVERLP